MTGGSDQENALRSALQGRYDVVRGIGEGGMATVYLAHDPRHGRDVAVKVLRPEIAAAVGPERFLREIQLAAQLQHPNILALIDSGEFDGSLFYIMPYVAGESLRQRLDREGALAVPDAVRLATEIADALSVAHRRGVVHRDIKPENILLQEGHALVADFGIARAVSDSPDQPLTQAGYSLGTPAYMSPEQIEGAAGVDGRSDIYSLGCVLFEMLTGAPPFRAATAQGVLLKHMTEAPPALSGTQGPVPSHVATAVTRAMQKDVTLRVATAAEFAEALAGSQIATPVYSAMVARPRGAGLLPRRIAMMAAAVVAVGAAYFAVTTLRNQPGAGQASNGTIRIAIMPFTTSGPDVDVYREGMVNLLSTNLDGLSDVRAIDSRTVMARWDEKIGAGTRPDLDVVLGVAKATGATHALIGGMVSTGDSIRLTARIHNLSTDSDEPLPEGRGNVQDIFGVVDRMSVALARSLLGSSPEMGASGSRLASLTTTSIPALRLYLQAEALYRKGAFETALPLLDQAIKADSSFALAIVRKAQTLGWLPAAVDTDTLEASRRAIRAVLGRLAPRDAVLAEAGIIDFADRDANGVRMLREFVTRYPDEAEGWYQLSDFLFHLTNIRGGTRDEVLDGFDKAVDLGPRFAPYYIHAISGALWRSDSARTSHLLDRYRALAGEDARWKDWVVQQEIVFGRDNTRLARIASDTAALRRAVVALVPGSNQPQTIADAAGYLAAQPATRIVALLRAGRWAAARAQMRQLPADARTLIDARAVKWVGAFGMRPADVSMILDHAAAGPQPDFWNADPKAAYQKLLSARDDGTGADPMVLASMAERAGDPDAAATLFTEESWREYAPAALFRLAKVHEANGHIAEAAKYYREFQTMWSGADVDLAPVRAAREAIQRLGK